VPKTTESSDPSTLPGAKPDAPFPRVAIVVSRYNHRVTDALRAGALGEYLRRGGIEGGTETVFAPGAFELPVIAAAAVRSGRFAGVVALGCVVRGETDHDRYISAAVADQIARLSVDTLVPVAFGVITANTPQQALARSAHGDEPGGKGNKGAEAMAAVLETIAAIGAIGSGASAKMPELKPDKTATAAGGPV
jgi:6,7-dimethyl-8-ribityllumazine synthase